MNVRDNVEVKGFKQTKGRRSDPLSKYVTMKDGRVRAIQTRPVSYFVVPCATAMSDGDSGSVTTGSLLS